MGYSSRELTTPRTHMQTLDPITPARTLASDLNEKPRVLT